MKHGFSADRVADIAQHVPELGVEAEDALCTHGRAAKFLPKTLDGVELLEQFRARSGRMVFVGDEYGVAQCIMTRAIYCKPFVVNCSPGAPRCLDPAAR